MTRHVRVGHVHTVLGWVAPEALGLTLPHEHILFDLSFMAAGQPEVTAARHAGMEMDGHLASWGQRHWNENVDNLRIDDESLAVEEVSLFAADGGGAMADATTREIGRDPLALARISRRTGVKIVMGTGHYVDATHRPATREQTCEEIAAQMVDELTIEAEVDRVPAGLIGEIGCSWPLTTGEHKVLKAAALAQRHTGAPLNIHPGRNERSPFEILEILHGEGVDLGRVIMSHVERTIQDPAGQGEIAKRGCYLEFDLFGVEAAYYPLARHIDMPNDGQRLKWIQQLFEKGHGQQVLISHDVFTKTRLVRYGGHGYSHILRTVLPMMRTRGIGDDEVRQLLYDNPQRALAFSGAS